MNYFFRLLILLICIINISSCCIKSNNNFIKSVETISLTEGKVIDSAFSKIVKRIIKTTDSFETEVNLNRNIKIKYFIVCNSYCRNDSFFIKFQSRSGTSFFYGLENKINANLLENYILLSGFNRPVIINKFNRDLKCNIEKLKLFELFESRNDMKIEWYKDSNVNWIGDFNPYFIESYYIIDEKFKFFKLEYLNTIVKLKYPSLY